ncbi:T9SS type A sorting domain-containing protein, partial [Flavobacterium sp. RSP29]|uniref:T9SS type A sorting domain-containing protein n=1 Tax=Flavobacterium sp. RSP29 TaxID=3401731 RepID=UPI003AB036A6
VVTTTGNLAVGNHTFYATVTNNITSCDANAQLVITINATPAAVADGGTLFCDGSAFTLSSTGSSGAATLIYAWTTIDGNIVDGDANKANPSVTKPGTYTLTLTDGNGCTATDDAVVTGPVNCAHIFPTATTCCNYLGGIPENFVLENICLTVEGNKIKNAIPGVFFYYGDYYAAKGGQTTIIVDQTTTGGLFKFDPQNTTNVRLFVDDCKSVTPISIIIGGQVGQGNVRIVFNAIAGHTYVISVKYDVKSIIGKAAPTIGAYASFGMKIKTDGDYGALVGVGKVNAVVGCSDTSGAPSGSCKPTVSGKVAPIEKIEIAKNTSDAGFDAYPVPFNELLTIKYNFDYVSDVKIEVFNSQGRLVLSKTDTNSYLNKEVTLKLNSRIDKAEVYVVKVTTNRGSSTKKVISSK